MRPLRRLIQQFQAAQWSRQRLEQLKAEGKTADEAADIIDEEGEARYGAIDWATLLPLILAILAAIFKIPIPSP